MGKEKIRQGIIPIGKSKSENAFFNMIDSSRFKGMVYDEHGARIPTEQDEEDFREALRKGEVYMPGEYRPHKNKKDNGDKDSTGNETTEQGGD